MIPTQSAPSEAIDRKENKIIQVMSESSDWDSHDEWLSSLIFGIEEYDLDCSQCPMCQFKNVKCEHSKRRGYSFSKIFNEKIGKVLSSIDPKEGEKCVNDHFDKFLKLVPHQEYQKGIYNHYYSPLYDAINRIRVGKRLIQPIHKVLVQDEKNDSEYVDTPELSSDEDSLGDDTDYSQSSEDFYIPPKRSKIYNTRSNTSRNSSDELTEKSGSDSPVRKTRRRKTKGQDARLKNKNTSQITKNSEQFANKDATERTMRRCERERPIMNNEPNVSPMLSIQSSPDVVASSFPRGQNTLIRSFSTNNPYPIPSGDLMTDMRQIPFGKTVGFESIEQEETTKRKRELKTGKSKPRKSKDSEHSKKTYKRSKNVSSKTSIQTHESTDKKRKSDQSKKAKKIKVSKQVKEFYESHRNPPSRILDNVIYHETPKFNKIDKLIDLNVENEEEEEAWKINQNTNVYHPVAPLVMPPSVFNNQTLQERNLTNPLPSDTSNFGESLKVNSPHVLNHPEIEKNTPLNSFPTGAAAATSLTPSKITDSPNDEEKIYSSNGTNYILEQMKYMPISTGGDSVITPKSEPYHSLSSTLKSKQELIIDLTRDRWDTTEDESY